VTHNAANDFRPAFSPDGSKVAFTRQLDRTNYEVYLMGADGSAQTNVSRSAGIDDDSAFSPDGTKIAYVHQDRVEDQPR
jgi:Tol biopolymer transport system component